MIVLDTQAWLWWLHDPRRLSRTARALIAKQQPGRRLKVSAISVWEVAVKAAAGKLGLPLPIDEWYEAASRDQAVSIEPVAPADLLASTLLPGDFHRDPADRIIVAFARRRGARLLTADRKILDYPHVQATW